MSNRDRLIKSINALGRKSKGAILMPMTPKPTPTPRKKIQPMKSTEPIVELPNIRANLQWQIKWIEEYAQLREEANLKLKSERALNGEQANEIVTLKAKIEKQNDLLSRMLKKLEKKSERIGKYKSKYLEAKTLLEQQSVDVLTNKYPILTENPIYVTHVIDQSEPTVKIEENTAQPKVLAISKVKKGVSTVPPLGKQKFADTQPVLVENTTYVTHVIDQSEPTVKIEENTAQPKVLAISKVKKEKSGGKYKCPDCEYTANKQYDLNVHRAEFCRTKPIKDRQCKYCNKMFTRRALRVHLVQFLNRKHTPKGKHKNVSFDDHKAYLDEVKAELK